MPAYQTTYYPDEKINPIQIMGLSHDSWDYNFNKVFVQETARGTMYNVVVGGDDPLSTVIAGIKLIQKEIRNK